MREPLAPDHLEVIEMACRYQTAVCVEESSTDPRFRDLCEAHAAILNELLAGDSAPATSPVREREDADAPH